MLASLSFHPSTRLHIAVCSFGFPHCPNFGQHNPRYSLHIFTPFRFHPLLLPLAPSAPFHELFHSSDVCSQRPDFCFIFLFIFSGYFVNFIHKPRARCFSYCSPVRSSWSRRRARCCGYVVGATAVPVHSLRPCRRVRRRGFAPTVIVAAIASVRSSRPWRRLRAACARSSTASPTISQRLQRHVCCHRRAPIAASASSCKALYAINCTTALRCMIMVRWCARMRWCRAL